MSKYEPLAKFLSRSATSEIRLTFREIEALIGEPLPDSARRHAAWWSNSDSHVQALFWKRQGWRSAQLDLAGEKIVFVREPAGRRPAAPSGTTQPGDRQITLDMASLPLRVQRAIRDEARIHSTDLATAVQGLLDALCAARRRDILDRLAELPTLPGDSVAMIREDRDAR